MNIFKYSAIFIIVFMAETTLSGQNNLKGSQLQLQRYINNFQDEFSEYIFSKSSSLLLFSSSNIEWVSPLSSNNYKEYQDDFLEILGLGHKTIELRKYWPKNGPVWDGLGIVVGKQKGILLIEAKAHKTESLSDMKATDPRSVSQIEEVFKETKKFFNVSEQSDWTKKRYQLANRVSFLYLLNEKLKIPTWLIVVNFIEDKTYIPTSKRELIKHNQIELKELGLHPDSPLLDKLIITFLEIKP